MFWVQEEVPSYKLPHSLQTLIDDEDAMSCVNKGKEASDSEVVV